MEADNSHTYNVASSSQCSTQDGEVMSGEKCKESSFSMDLREPSHNYLDVTATGKFKLSTGEDVCEVEHTKSTQQKSSKCLIAVLVCVSVMLLLMTTTAFSLAVISYSKSMDEAVSSTNRISTLSNQYQQLASATQNNISQLKNYVSSLQKQIHCGAGQWYRVAFLNMSDPSHQCPFPWQFNSSSGVRRCQRSSSSGVSCSSKSYSTGRGYGRVCGRVIAHQYGSPDAFNRLTIDNPANIDTAYMDGVSITYGNPRRHIWSYVGGLTEGISNSRYVRPNCPCSIVSGRGPPSYIGNNYYCESGNPTNTYNLILYTGDKLWDGQQCEGTCCSGTKTPPWFSVHVAKHTTDSIEVRICGDEGTDNENTPIELLEIYVQ